MTTDCRARADRVMAHTYNRFPIVIVSGNDCVVFDETGNAYIDFTAGIAVCNLGHARPEIASAVCEQAGRLVHTSNLYYTLPQVALAEWLTRHSFADKVFFCNSGAEANEAAIKLARKYFSGQGRPDRFRIIAMEQSFHGRTMGTLSATGQDKIKQGYFPVLEGFSFVPFNDIDAVKSAMTETTAAVLVEPVQGEGGIRVSAADYLPGLRRLCDDSGTLLIFDEIQTGVGRTGKLFAYEHSGITPDIMTLAKALANGLPIGAMLAKDSVMEAFTPGAHASTFGGTPLVTRAALATLTLLTETGILAQSVTTGAYFKTRLMRLKEKHRVIKSVRGIGLLLGLSIDAPAGPIVGQCLEKGFLINCVQETILRFVPPLTIRPEQIDALVDCLDGIFSEM